MNQNFLRLRAVFGRIVFLLGLFFTMWNPSTLGQVYEKVFDFTEARAADVVSKGFYPYASLVQGSDGNFYGTTQFDEVFKMTPEGVLTTLVVFTGNGAVNKGTQPFAGLVKGGDGNFYGTTREGGAHGLGTVFKMAPAGTLTTLVEFTGDGASNKGAYPHASLVQDNDGNFYGTTREGGALGLGTVFKITPVGVLTTLVEFTGVGGAKKGAYPYAALLRDSDGNFYGTTNGKSEQGVQISYGTVFKMTTNGTPAGTTLTTLVEFAGNVPPNKGASPYASLVQGSDGNFYGTTLYDATNGLGSVFKMTTNGTPAGTTLTILVEFTGMGGAKKGALPYAGLVEGSDGNFYGTTAYGGAMDLGTVFRMTPAGDLTTLVEFSFNGAENKGARPYANLAQGSDGNLYGTTVNGGAYNYGTVFKVTRAGVLTTLVEFTGGGASNKGRYPFEGVQDSDGNFYGTSVEGGANGLGTVFKMSPAGVLATLVEFTGVGGANKGASPRQCLVQGRDHNFYGTTSGGGAYSYGTVFKMTSAGVLTTLVEFTFDGATNKGSRPYAGLAEDSVGNFYGSTERGGANGLGTLFKMTTNGTPAGTTLTTLVEFTGIGGAKKGAYPHAALVKDSDGNFYGTTDGLTEQQTDTIGAGTVFKMTTNGTLAGTMLTTLVEFTGIGGAKKGAFPYAGLVQGSGGDFYGTTRLGGANGFGTVFKMTTNGTPAGTTLMTLVEFTRNGPLNKGEQPVAGLVKGGDGNFYGATKIGGANGLGTVFKMTPAGDLTTLREFLGGSDGDSPLGNLIAVSDGNLYGTTSGFGTGGDGTIYRLIFAGAPTVAVRNVSLPGRSSALLEAQVNARGTATVVSLEYGTDGVNFQNTVPVAFGLTGYQTKLVGTTLAGLAPGTTYFFRFRATSSAGPTVSTVASFSTLAEPVVTISPASEVAPTSARFNASVNARNYDATVVFEWGTDGNSFPNTASAVPGTVMGNSNMAVTAFLPGLTKGVTYFYRLKATNAAGTTVSGIQSFTTLIEPIATVGASFALTTTSARVDGTVRARNSDAQVFFDYGTDGVNFPISVAATPSLVSGDTVTAVTADLLNLSQVPYFYRVRAVSDGGTAFSAHATLNVAVLSGFAQQLPGSVPPGNRQGIVFVTLTVPGGLTGAGWRFVGEQQWRASAVSAGGFTTGDRVIEFRPIPGLIQPAPESVTVLSGGTPTVLEREYYETDTVGSGGLSVTLKPEALAAPTVPVADRAQWRLLGDDDAQWRDTGTVLAGLLPGNYLVECKPVAGRTTPPPLTVPVREGQTSAPTATYFLADALTGVPPDVVPFDTVSTSENLPYAYVGQILSNAGASSGFVVKPRVVATAAHVVFDDGALTAAPLGTPTTTSENLAPFAATGVQWHFQRDRGTHEPKPQIPRGFYVLSGYAAQRIVDRTPGQSTPDSQNLDAAALYFLEDAGRGGYGGFLASDSAQNEFLMSQRLKTLVGYPVDNIATANQGRMHATPPANVTFAPAFGRTYTTAQIRSSGGGSGGPLCVQFDSGKYYPAAIYLGGTEQTVVRAIDSQVLDLFTRAEVSANGGANNTGGGIIQVNTPALTPFPLASIKVDILPAAAVNGGARWKLGANATARTSGTQLASLTPGNYNLVFTGASGFITPATTSRTLSGSTLSTINATYNGITTHPTNRTVFAFEDATFSVAVSGTPTNYQWRFKPTAGATVLIPGATSSSYTRSDAHNSAEGEYAVAVTWLNGAILSSFATLTVNPTAQAITFPQPPNRILDDGCFVLDASASSDLPVTFQLLSGPATLSGDTLCPTGLGTVTVRASQAGNANYRAAANKIRSFDVLGDNLNAWRARRFTAAELGNPLVSGPLADFDGDGVKTLLEFALNLDPKLNDHTTMIANTGTRGLPLIRSENISGQQKLTAEYVRRRTEGQPGITYRMEFSGDLGNANSWTESNSEVVTQIDATWERVKVTDVQPALGTRYGRLKVTMP